MILCERVHQKHEVGGNEDDTGESESRVRGEFPEVPAILCVLSLRANITSDGGMDAPRRRDLKNLNCEPLVAIYII